MHHWYPKSKVLFIYSVDKNENIKDYILKSLDNITNYRNYKIAIKEDLLINDSYEYELDTYTEDEVIQSWQSIEFYKEV